MNKIISLLFACVCLLATLAGQSRIGQSTKTTAIPFDSIKVREAMSIGWPSVESIDTLPHDLIKEDLFEADQKEEIPIPRFRLYQAQVIDVYDGDTFTVVIEVGFGIQLLQKVRLADVDAWEVRGEEREAGLKARDYVRDLILHKRVTLITTWPEEYGSFRRLIGDIYFPKEDKVLSQLLIENGHAEFAIYETHVLDKTFKD